MASNFQYLPTSLVSYFTEGNWQTAITEESDQVNDDTSSNFNETVLSATSEQNPCEVSSEKLCYKRDLKQKSEEVLHYAKRLSDLEKALTSKETQLQEYCKRNKGLEKMIEELTKRFNAEKQKMESSFTKERNSRDKQLDDLHKRLLEEQSKSMRLTQNQQYFNWRLTQEESRSKELKEQLDYYFTSFKCLRDNYNNDLKKMAAEEQQYETRLSRKDDELRVLHKELRDKTARLATSFEKRMKQDQRRVENTVELNTPSEVEKDFSDFFDGDRIDACEIIESMLCPEGEIDVEIYYPRLACLIFVTAYEQVKEAKEAASDLFQNVTTQLIHQGPRMCQELCHASKESGASTHFPITFDLSPGKVDQEIPTDVLDGMMLSLKQSSHSCNLDCFENDVKKTVWKRWRKYVHEEEASFLPAPSEDVLTQLGDYIKECIRLTWRMVTQIPPMQLEYRAVQFDKDIHKRTRFQYHSEYCSREDQLSGQVISENIACYLWPALLEAGGRIIFPGEVLCKLESVNLDYVVIQ